MPSNAETHPLLNPENPPPTYVTTQPLSAESSQEMQLEDALITYKKMHDIYERSFSSNVWCSLFGGSLTIFSLSILVNDIFFPHSFYASLIQKHFIECLTMTILIPLCFMALIWEVLEHRSDNAEIELKKTIECFLSNTNNDSEKLFSIKNRVLEKERIIA